VLLLLSSAVLKCCRLVVRVVAVAVTGACLLLVSLSCCLSAAWMNRALVTAIMTVAGTDSQVRVRLCRNAQSRYV
jgi:hypothetical protein